MNFIMKRSCLQYQLESWQRRILTWVFQINRNFVQYCLYVNNWTCNKTSQFDLELQVA